MSERRFVLATALAAFVLWGLRLPLVTVLPFNLDECCEVAQAGRVARGEVPYSSEWVNPKTPLLHLYLAPLFGLSSAGGDVVLYARLAMVPWALVMVVAVALCARRLWGPRAAALAALSLCSCSTFIDRSLRVRTDMVAAALWALALVWLIVPGEGRSAQEGRRRIVEVAGAGLVLGAAFLVTQKAAYFVLAGGLVLLLTRSSRDLVVFAGAAGAVTLGVLGGLSLYGGLGFRPFQSVFLHAATVGMRGFYRTSHWAVMALEESPFFWGGAVVGLAAMVVHARYGDDRRAMGLPVAAVVVTGLVLAHPEQWLWLHNRWKVRQQTDESPR